MNERDIMSKTPNMVAEQATGRRQNAVVMPWDKRALELEPIEGTYCHYAAWKEWFEAWNARQSSAFLLDLTEVDTVALYAAFCAACSECSLA